MLNWIVRNRTVNMYKKPNQTKPKPCANFIHPHESSMGNISYTRFSAPKNKTSF